MANSLASSVLQLFCLIRFLCVVCVCRFHAADDEGCEAQAKAPTHTNRLFMASSEVESDDERKVITPPSRTW